MAPESFWEVLASRVNRGSGTDDGDGRLRGPAVRQAWDPGLRVVLLAGWRPADHSWVPHESHPARWGSPTERPPRQQRLLTEAQRAALEVLRGAGADTLPDCPTWAELRHAFRQLALRWHPDRHPVATPAERGEHARVFAQITDAYRQLVGDRRQAA